jgi:probable F420-dependent oxidoreductase
MKLGVWYDFRNPGPWQLPWERLYRELLDQAAYAEELGFDSVWLSEHHFTDEGYLPSITAMLAVLAERTTRIRIGTAVLLAPLHHPLRLAEDLAVVDQLSGGRLEVGVAPGYRPEEFAVLGVPRSERGTRTDEAIELLRLGWSGKRFSFLGRHFSFTDVVVTPPPAREEGPPIWVGGNSMAAATRAARHRCGFMPDSGASAEIFEAYRSQFPGPASTQRVATNRVIFAAGSADEAWSQAGEYLLYQFNQYRKWFSDASDPDSHGRALTDVGQLSRDHYFVGTPEEILDAISTTSAQFGYDELIFWARPPGMPIEASTRSLELIASNVLPVLHGTPRVERKSDIYRNSNEFSRNAD